MTLPTPNPTAAKKALPMKNAKADIKARTSDDWDVTLLAISEGKGSSARAIVEAGGVISQNGSGGTAPIVHAAFGGFDRWEAEFRRIANGLGGGSGWVVLGYNHQFGTAENYWMADHTSSPATTTPLLVMDMYEHSYHMDFGAAAAMYVDAFFNNIKWETVLQRIESLRA